MEFEKTLRKPQGFRLTGVQPQFEQLNGRNPLAFIASANLNRRNLTKGQQAMALAKIYREPERGRGKKDEAQKGAESASFSYRRVKQARQVLAHSACTGRRGAIAPKSVRCPLRLPIPSGIARVKFLHMQEFLPQSPCLLRRALHQQAQLHPLIGGGCRGDVECFALLFITRICAV